MWGKVPRNQLISALEWEKCKEVDCFQLAPKVNMVEAIYRLTQSDLEGAVNLGGEEYVTVAELVETVIDISGKEIGIRYVEGPVGVQSRNFNKARSRLLGWQAQTTLREGIAKTYAWVEGQVRQHGG